MSSDDLYFVREREITRRLLELDRLQRIAFAAACCERLLPLYLAFHEKAHWGNPGFLRRGLDAVWVGLERRCFDDVPTPPSEALDKEEDDGICPGIFSAVDSWSPDTPGLEEADAAVQVCCAIYELLDAVHGDANVDFASRTALTVVDAHIYDTRADLDINHRASRGVADRDPLMVREYERQIADLKLLSVKLDPRSAAADLRDRSTGRSVLESS